MNSAAHGFEELTIESLHAGFRAGTITAHEVTQWYLDRIADSGLNAVVTTNRRALDEAAELDRRWAPGAPVGPLHGVPVLVKDQGETAGIPTSFGSELFADYIPQRDCTVVARLRTAGRPFVNRCEADHSVLISKRGRKLQDKRFAFAF